MGRSFSRSKKTNNKIEIISASYISGSAIRKPQIIEPEPKAKEKKAKQVKKKVAKSKVSVSKSLVAMDKMNMAYFVLFTAFTLFCLANFYKYIKVQSEVTNYSNKLYTKENELKKLKDKNDADETNLNSYVDLAHVYEVATGEYGMVPADKSQVIIYKKNESEYIQQNEEIPRNKK
jgi:septum formation initiator